MAKKSKGISWKEFGKKSVTLSDKSVKALLRRINRIRTNYKPNIKYIEQRYAPIFKKSTFYDTTLPKEDVRMFDRAYELIMANPKSIKRNKAIQKKVKDFLEKYEFFGMYKERETLRRFNIKNRDEWIDAFRDLNLDEKLIDEIKKLGLWDNPKFWGEFFRSEFFIPLYRKYTFWDKHQIEEAGLKSSWYNKEYSIWGKYLKKYLGKWKRTHH